MSATNAERAMAAELVALMGDDYREGTLDPHEMIAYTGACMTLESPVARPQKWFSLGKSLRSMAEAEFTHEILAGYRNMVMFSVGISLLILICLWIFLIIAGLLGRIP